jgi:hypothetical protein
MAVLELLLENENFDLLVSTLVDFVFSELRGLNMDGAWFEGLPKMENGSLLAGSSGSLSSLSMDSLDGLPLPGDETPMSPNEAPSERAPEEGLLDFASSLAAVPSGLKEDPRTKPSVFWLPNGFFVSLALGAGKEESLEGLPNGFLS